MKITISFIAVIVILLIAILWKFAFQKKRHHWYIKRARMIYKNINEKTNIYTEAQLMNYLRQINPYVFEELLLVAFEHKGYKVIRNRQYSGDGGIDGHVIIDKQKIPIQAKRYKSYIKREHVAAFAHLIERKKVPYGLFIHTGKTGNSKGDPSYSTVRIISGQKLIRLLDKYYCSNVQQDNFQQKKM